MKMIKINDEHYISAGQVAEISASGGESAGFDVKFLLLNGIYVLAGYHYQRAQLRDVLRGLAAFMVNDDAPGTFVLPDVTLR
jgi:hypothetical protein